MDKPHHKRLSFKIYLFAVIFLLVLLFTPAALAEKTNTSGGFSDIKLNVPIPGLGQFIKYDPSNPNTLATYIKAVYKFLVGTAGMLAVVMVAVGGLQWLFSGGASDKITKAKETILGAVAGLILALSSYLILNTLNPNLVKFSKVAISPVGIKGVTVGLCEPSEKVLMEQKGQAALEVDYNRLTCGKEAFAGDFKKMCVGRKCEEAEAACVKANNRDYQCLRCDADMDDDRLRGYGLPEGAEGCRILTPVSQDNQLYPEKTKAYYCNFSEDGGLDPNDDVCALIKVDCSEISTCEDYASVMAVDGSFEEAVKDLDESEHLEKICTKDLTGNSNNGGVCRLKDIKCTFGGQEDEWTCTGESLP